MNPKPQAPRPDPGNLIVGLLVGRTELLPAVTTRLEEEFGAIDLGAVPIEFVFTDYYAPEMGDKLLRTWLSFARLQALEDLVWIKLTTGMLENEFRTPTGLRRVNLDPGLLTRHNLVLATTKDYAHRIYLGQGIFAELTLVYDHGHFRPERWTYPDYRTPTALNFLKQVRRNYLEKLKENR